jgi:hypothetical protein
MMTDKTNPFLDFYIAILLNRVGLAYFAEKLAAEEVLRVRDMVRYHEEDFFKKFKTSSKNKEKIKATLDKCHLHFNQA